MFEPSINKDHLHYCLYSAKNPHLRHYNTLMNQHFFACVLRGEQEEERERERDRIEGMDESHIKKFLVHTCFVF